MISARHLLFTSFILLLHGCGEDGTPMAPTEPVPDQSESRISLDPELATAVQQLMGSYLTQIDTDFVQAGNDIQLLNNEVSMFLDTPSDDRATSLRNTWLDAHSSYETSTLHRYFADVILPEQQGLRLFELQYELDHWPILPGYIDYVGEYPESGIVNDMTVPLEQGFLREQHGAFDVNEASTGFHVMEFMLWGENSIESGMRPTSDYLPISRLSQEQQADGIELFQLSGNRRREFLTLNADMLNTDFQSLVNIWAAASVDYRASVQSASGEELLFGLLSAVTNMLTEELLVRSLYPMLNGEFRESLPSIYSHSSPATVSAQLAGLENLLQFSESTANTNLDEILSILSEDFAEFFYQNFDASKECLVVLYAAEENPQTTAQSAELEFKVVECINLLTNMIDYLEQIKLKLDLNTTV